MFPRGACPAKSGGSMMKTEGAQGGEIHSMHSPRSGTRERSELGLGLEKKRISHKDPKVERGIGRSFVAGRVSVPSSGITMIPKGGMDWQPLIPILLCVSCDLCG